MKISSMRGTQHWLAVGCTQPTANAHVADTMLLVTCHEWVRWSRRTYASPNRFLGRTTRQPGLHRINMSDSLYSDLAGEARLESWKRGFIRCFAALSKYYSSTISFHSLLKTFFFYKNLINTSNISSIPFKMIIFFFFSQSRTSLSNFGNEVNKARKKIIKSREWSKEKKVS